MTACIHPIRMPVPRASTGLVVIEDCQICGARLSTVNGKTSIEVQG